MTSERTAAITGSASGIGAATARLCAQSGAAVALGARRADRIEALAERIVARIKNPHVRLFWTHEFANYPENYKREAMGPVLNKIQSFLVYEGVSNILDPASNKVYKHIRIDYGGTPPKEAKVPLP